MQYIASRFTFEDPDGYISDLLASFLGELGYESFEKTSSGLDAYIPAALHDEEALSGMINDFQYSKNISFVTEEVETKNWNEEWEKHFFEPIIIADECIVHSSFHSDVPRLKYNIIIDPKMAFGTGHHETTSLMIAEILKHDFTGKRVLDMGCGTSVLAILAAKRGAEALTAIDIDDWCVDNSIENIALNKVQGIEVLLGDASLLPGRKFDIILANINRNILLNDMDKYAAGLEPGGVLFISGFYTEDIPVLQEKALTHSLHIIYHHQKNNWAVVKLEKR